MCKEMVKRDRPPGGWTIRNTVTYEIMYIEFPPRLKDKNCYRAELFRDRSDAELRLGCVQRFPLSVCLAVALVEKDFVIPCDKD
jgi:hypothetical protein